MRSLKLSLGCGGGADLLVKVVPFLALFKDMSEARRPLSMPSSTRAGDVGPGGRGGGMWSLTGE
jgi:hypothetical protein